MKNFALACFVAISLTTAGWGQYEIDDSASQMEAVNKLTVNLQDLRKLSQALDVCRRILKKSPNHFAAMVNTCRICWHIGAQLESEDKAKETFKRGFEQAERLKTKYPNKPDGYYWYAVNYGEYIERSSLFAKLGGFGKILDNAKKALELDPSYDFGGACLIVGRINQMTPGGNDQLVREYYLEAIQYAPNRSTGHLYLGEWYYDKKDYKQALFEMETLLKSPIDSRFPIERKKDEPKAKEWIEKIKEKMD